MFRQVVPLAVYAGNYRQLDPERPCLNKPCFVAGVAGYPPVRVPTAMAELIKNARTAVIDLELHWRDLQVEDRARRIAQVVAYLVGHFIRIHPFINGNGRTSRLLWAWVLMRFGTRIQARIGLRPSEPYDEIMSRAMRGDFSLLQLHVLTHLRNNVPRQVA